MTFAKTLILASALTAASGALAVQASAADRVEVGMLDCTVEGGVGFVFGSSRDLTCTFTPADPAVPADTYAGVINKYGLDLGVTGTTLIKWAVVSPTEAPYAAGALAGEYNGAQASASFAAGLGANVLVGGSNESFGLQPVSIQAQDGVNIAVGVASLTLIGTPG
ncbi:uncharacterized protein DUF992 [Hoeflea marina]|uniref:Uncharacterized protein DUF992 n=1 Tax=Hoeflea marina TaxID=274592 RepID=A0A317PI29_9HYPH|nr:DUF992 domain-containing protein [Hoeflea marina]PWV99088.1 uncharacterized protein DUF992 [Hoeflea marina]